MKHIVGQHVLIGISGHSLTQEEKSFIVENNIGGVVLFSRNVKEPKQIHDLCSEIQSLAQLTPEKTPLYIGIDMEGGRVARLKKPFTEWPPLKKLGDLDSPTMSFNLAQAMGAELHAVGINLDFAPCIDTFTNPKNTVIGDRAVSVDPQMVAKHASALIRGYLKADVMPCAKHFPGHGHTIIDSHEDLPEEEADLQRLNEVELVPFKKSFKSKIEMIMTAHIRFKNVDPEWPVTLSEIFLKQILRDQLGYQGLVITDDLDMKAMAKHYEKNFIPVKSLQAGANLLLYCNEPESPPIAIEAIFAALASKQLDKAHLENNYKTLLRVKKDNANCFKIPSWSEAQKQIGLGSHQDISKAIAEGRILENLMA